MNGPLFENPELIEVPDHHLCGDKDEDNKPIAEVFKLKPGWRQTISPSKRYMWIEKSADTDCGEFDYAYNDAHNDLRR